jgi:hypothetical protein
LPKNPIPTVVALLVCESVIQDAETRKKTLVGIFDKISSPGAPVVLSGVGLYAKLVEGNGQYAFRVRLMNTKDLDEASPLANFEVSVNWEKPGQPLEFAVNFRGLVFPDFGDYEFQLFADDVYLGRGMIHVESLAMPPGGGKQWQPHR